MGPDDDRPLTGDTPFRIASTTKPMTAVVILRLAEQGRLGLDDPISRYLPESLVDRLHVLDGRSYGGLITIRMLLGLIAESASGRSLTALYRTMIFDPLGLKTTYLEGREPGRGDIVRSILSDVDATDHDPSFDWGGGGVVSTVGDLATFFAALVEGEFFDDPANRGSMVLTAPDHHIVVVANVNQALAGERALDAAVASMELELKTGASAPESAGRGS